MKTLKVYAIEHGIKYRAAWNRFKLGKIPGAYQDEFGKILIPDDTPNKPLHVAVYARVSSSQNKANLDKQVERLIAYSNHNGLPVKTVVKECASGLNDQRKKLMRLLYNPDITHLVVEHKDRLTRFGFNYISCWMEQRGVKVVVVNEAVTDKDDLMQDFISLVTSFCARIYGLRRSKRQTERILKAVK
jgi:putative resolvase